MCTSFKQLWSAGERLKLFEDKSQPVTASAVIQSSLSPQPSLPLHVLYLSSSQKCVPFPDPLGFCGEIRSAAEERWGSVPSLPPGQTIWNPGTTGSGPRLLRREGGKCIRGAKDADEREGGGRRPGGRDNGDKTERGAGPDDGERR